jgi:hypothetical protein
MVVAFLILLTRSMLFAEAASDLKALPKYIIEIEAFKLTSKKSCEEYDNLRKCKSTEERNAARLKMIDLEPDSRQFKYVFQVDSGRGNYNTLYFLKYAEKQKDGTYILVKTLMPEGVLFDLVCTNSIGYPFKSLEKKNLFIKGKIRIGMCKDREVFAPFPLAKIGKPIPQSYFELFQIWNHFTPIPINKKTIMSITGAGNNKIERIYITTILIIPRKEWDGNSKDIYNKKGGA